MYLARAKSPKWSHSVYAGVTRFSGSKAGARLTTSSPVRFYTHITSDRLREAPAVLRYCLSLRRHHFPQCESRALRRRFDDLPTWSPLQTSAVLVSCTSDCLRNKVTTGPAGCSSVLIHCRYNFPATPELRTMEPVRCKNVSTFKGFHGC